MQEITKILRKKGFKVTPQRLAIYNMLMNTNEHPTAETIYKNLVIDNPSMSLATVYKTLDSFKKSGLIKELSVGECCLRYDAITKNHSHIVCTNCNKVIDIMENISEEILKRVSEKTNYTITSEQLIFYGICDKCKPKKQH